MELHSNGIDPSKLAADLSFLDRCLLDALEDGPDARLLRSLFQESALQEIPEGARPIQSLSLRFALVDMAEENAAAQSRRSREASGVGIAPDSWFGVLSEWNAAGVSAQDAKALLWQVSVEPVLTAHPTEAKRTSILQHQRELYLLLVQLENRMWTPDERASLRLELLGVLDRLWRTSQVYEQRPDVRSEFRNAVHYLAKAIPQALPWLDNRFRSAWVKAGYAAHDLPQTLNWPRLSLGCWVGGDRDGHPGVTHVETAWALQELRKLALDLVRTKVLALSERLSLSAAAAPPPNALLERIGILQKQCGREPPWPSRGEPWRRMVNLIQMRIPEQESGAEDRYASAEELKADLQLLRDSLAVRNMERLAVTEVDPVLRLVDLVGFHLARLDMRQNSAFYARALGQLCTAAGMVDPALLSHEERREFFQAEFESGRPFLSSPDTAGSEAQEAVASLRVFANHHHEYGPAGLGSLIVSMTRDACDLFTVLLLAREAGLWMRSGGGYFVPLPVVPLFETIDDLERAPVVLEEWLRSSVVRRSLQAQSWQGNRVQQVMVGYSDSNKDGGPVSAIYALRKAEEALLATGKQHGTRILFFHGRGGSPGRGAGPTDRFLGMLPPGALSAGLRMTEQGESVSRKYANRITAVHQLEALLAGVARRLRVHQNEDPEPGLDLPVWERLEQTAHAAYLSLVQDSRFIPFFRGATPIDVLEHARIGSRPPRRTGQATLADLRAIPWNFSWAQARFFLPSWYGLGSALEALRGNASEWKCLQQAWKRDGTFQFLMGNAMTGFLMSDFKWMLAYADLAGDATKGILDRIQEERSWVKIHLCELLELAEPSEWLPHVTAALSLRSKSLDILHAMQIEMLVRWRNSGSSAEDPLLVQLLESINALAAGLGTTG